MSAPHTITPCTIPPCTIPPCTVYAHGLPGSTDADLTIALQQAGSAPSIHSLNRLEYLGTTTSYAEDILLAFDNQPCVKRRQQVRLVAFSLGAMSALHIAAARPDLVAKVELIAPAAPLQLSSGHEGPFVDHMAGGAIFKLAIKAKWQLALLTRLQAAGFAIAPQLIARQMFKAAPPSEQSLLAQPVIKCAFIDGTRHAIAQHHAAYCTEMRAYVADWTDVLAKVQAPVRIWQGDQDNWVPPAMAQALAAQLAPTVDFRWLEGLSHYGALHHALPLIMQDDGARAATHMKS